MTDALALQGGRPSVPVELIAHDWERYRKAGDDEVDAVTAVLRSGHLSIAAGAGMPQADALEEEFARWVGTDHCLAVNTGTASLHCAVAGVGVEAGDQVIVPAYTFIASAMVVLQHNAVPVFVDTDPQTYLIDPDRIEEKITDRTRAIMVVHLHGLRPTWSGSIASPGGTGSRSSKTRRRRTAPAIAAGRPVRSAMRPASR